MISVDFENGNGGNENLALSGNENFTSLTGSRKVNVR